MFDKNAISKQNLYYANLKREKRIQDQLDEIEREKKANEQLQYQIEQDKLYQIEKKNKIKQNQYEEYTNYLRKKYSTPPQYREKLNIKLGGENRNIRKPNYNEEMENLCLNPTTEKNIYPTTPTINYSEMGRNYQKGYSHGYNIITGEVYSNQYNNKNNDDKKINQIESINNNLDNKNKREAQQNYNYNISREEYEEFLQYKEMKRQREIEEMEREKYNNYLKNNINNSERIAQNERAPNQNREENEMNYINRQYQNEVPPPDFQKLQFYKDKMNEKEEMNQSYQTNIPQNYKNINNNDIKDNFHYDKDNLNPDLQNNISDRERIENIYKQNLYMQNKFYEDYEKRYIQKEQREKENNYMNQMQNYQPNNYQKDNLPIQKNDYYEKNIIQNKNDFYPSINNERNMSNYEYQNQFQNREQDNIPIEYQRNQRDENNNIPSEYQRNIERKDYENIPYSDQRRENNIQPDYEKEKEMMLRQQYNDEIQFKDTISLRDNQQIMKNRDNEPMAREDNFNREQNEDIKNFEREKYLQYLKNNNNENNTNIKDIERERYLQFLMNKTNENKEQKDIINNNFNYQNINNYNQQMMNDPHQEEQMQRNDNFRNPEKDYYNNNQNEQTKYNNYISDNLNKLQRQREIEERDYQEEKEPKFLSYQEQIERIKKQEEFFEREKLKEVISQFNENRRRNMVSDGHIFNTNQVPPTPPKYTDEPLTSKEKQEMQREYAKYLDWQINEKNSRNSKTPFNPKYNPIIDDDNTNEKRFDNENNSYQQIREKDIGAKEIPITPYSKHNYNLPGNNYNNYYKK